MSVSHLKYPRLVDPIVASIVSNTLVRYSRVVELTEVVHMCRVALHRFDYVTRGWRRLLTRYRRMRHGATRDDLLETLGDALYDAYNVYGKAPLLKKAISAYRQALRLRPRGHPRRALSLANLGVAVQAFYETQNMDVTGLHRSIQLHREALDLRPPGHPSRPASLGHLSNALQSSFKQTGRIHHLAESKNRLREVMKFAPSDHRDRDGILNDLAHILRISFEQEGSQSSLEEAVVMYREALRIRLIEHAAPSVSLVDLASMPTRDSKEQSARSPLVEAVALLRATLNLCPPGHVARALVLSHLAHTLRLSFKQHGGRETIEESVFVHRQAVELCPPGSLHRDTFVEDLAITLSIFHDHFDNSDSLAEAIRLQRETLLLRPPGHAARHDSLCSLGVWLWRWAKSGGDSDARREAISMLREALEICPSGHPDRARLLSETGKRFLDTNTPFFDLERGMAYISDGLSVDSAPVRQRLADACSDLRLVVDAYRYAVGKTDPPTRESINLRTLEIYAQAIRLLPRAASFALDHAARLRVIVGSDELSRNAAAHAVTLGRKEDAIEMLEEGRGTFWSQALHRRATGLDGILEEDRQALRTIFSTLEQSHSLNDGSVSFEHREDELENRRQLAVEADVIIHRIRTHPGFQRFLMPAAYDALMTSLPDGYIVMVISAKRGYHALLLNGGVSPGAKSIHLKRPSGRGGFLSDPIRATLPTNLRRSVQTLSQSQTFIAIEELRATHTDKVPETLEDTLQVFWTYIMKPIVQALGLKVGQ
jgi:tetratricopeptide (TPR) repeat protein